MEDSRIPPYIMGLINNYKNIIPEEHWKKWCIVFGSRVLDTATSYEEAIQIHNDFRSRRIFTVILPPFGCSLDRLVNQTTGTEYNWPFCG